VKIFATNLIAIEKVGLEKVGLVLVSVATALFFSLDLGFFCFVWGSWDIF